jgi:hypothetical protein
MWKKLLKTINIFGCAKIANVEIWSSEYCKLWTYKNYQILLFLCGPKYKVLWI